MTTVRVTLSTHLRTLAGVDGEVTLDVDGAVTVRSVLDRLEAAHPALRGTIRDQRTKERNAYMRYFADGEDISRRGDDEVLPDAVLAGAAPLRVLGAIAGG